MAVGCSFCNRVLLTILTLSTYVLVTIGVKSEWDNRPGVVIFEGINASGVSAEFDGIEIRNLNRFLSDNNLSWAGHICLNGWWLLYENELFNNDETGCVDVITGYHCFNVIKSIRSLQAFSYPLEFTPQMLATFDNNLLTGGMTQFGRIMEYMQIMPSPWNKTEYGMKSGILTGGQAFTLFSVQSQIDDICFKPDFSASNESACFFMHFPPLDHIHEGFKWKRMELGCKADKIIYLTKCINYGERLWNIFSLTSRHSEKRLNESHDDTCGGNNVTLEMLDLLYKKFKYNLPSKYSPPLIKLNEPTEWKQSILEKIFALFILKCPSKWVNPDFVRLARDFFLVISNNTVESTEMYDLDITFRQRWIELGMLIDLCRTSDKIKILELEECENNKYFAKYWVNGTGKNATKNLIMRNSLIDNSTSFFNPIIDSAWWIFSSVFSACFRSVVRFEIETNPRREIAAQHYFIGTERDFFFQLRYRWEMETRESTMSSFDNLFSTDIKRNLENIKSCNWAISNEMEPRKNRWPKRIIGSDPFGT